MYDLKGKNAIVTGGATGIGYQYCKEMLKLGVNKCVIFDMNSKLGTEAAKNLCTEFGKDRAYFVNCDVTKMNEFETAMETAINVLIKKCDVLINNAGVMNDYDWETEIRINFNGVVNGVIVGMKYMGKNQGGNGGTIVNIASILGLNTIAGCPVYCGTKHAVVGLTKSYSLPYYYDKTGIRMMTMCPGVTDTDLISGASKRQMNNDVSQECHKELSVLPKQPPSHVANGMMHMLQNGANGSVWVCEGGQDIYEVSIPNRVDLRKLK